MTTKYQTQDGTVLELINDKWTDGNVTYDRDPHSEYGFPVNEHNIAFAGRVIERDCDCGGVMTMSDHCGAWVCESCENHMDMARCYCGWALSARSGYNELIEMGETIEPDE